METLKQISTWCVANPDSAIGCLVSILGAFVQLLNMVTKHHSEFTGLSKLSSWVMQFIERMSVLTSKGHPDRFKWLFFDAKPETEITDVPQGSATTPGKDVSGGDNATG